MSKLATIGPKLAAREALGICALLLLFAVIIVGEWQMAPSPVSPINASARIVRFGTYETDSPSLQPRMFVVVDIDNVGQRSLVEPAEMLGHCRTGAVIRVQGYRGTSGGIRWRLPLQGCSPLPPDSPAR